MSDSNLVFLNKRVFVIGSDGDFLDGLESLLSYTGALPFVYRDLEKAEDEFEKNLSHLVNLIILETKEGEEDFSALKILNRLRAVGLSNTPIILIKDKAESKTTELKDDLANFNVIQTFKKDGLVLTDLLKEAEKAIFSDDLKDNVIDISEKEPIIFKDNKKEMRILVVEDDPLLRNLLAIRLKKSQIPCRFSNDGSKALVDIKEYQPTLLILDLMLPEKDGFSVLEEIKKDETLAKIPVIVFSNKDSDEDKKRAKDLGAKAFLVKALTDLSDLVNMIFDIH